MNRKFFSTLFLMWCLSSSSPSEAVLIDLAEEDIQEAIQYGRDNKDASYLEFFKGWRVDLGYGTGSARIITAFSKIAFEAKHSPSDDVRLDPKDVEEILEDLKDRLAFGVALYGETRDFAQEASAVIIYEGETIQPVESRPSTKAEATHSWPQPPSYRAICYYYFNVDRIDPNGVVTLVVSVPDQKGVEFSFDLSAMK
ncbi:MAG: hypothetical protein ACE5IC_06575 [Candidatus Brocadiales bacterium]